MIATLLLLAQGILHAQTPDVLALFEVQAAGTRVSSRALDQVGQLLASRLAEGGVGKAVPKDDLRKRLSPEEARAWASCFAQACQLELARSVAARRALGARFARSGQECTLTVTVYDVAAGRVEAQGTGESACDDDGAIAAAGYAAAAVLGKLSPSRAAAAGKVRLDWVRSRAGGIELTRSEVTVAQFRACVEAGVCGKDQFRTVDSCNYEKPDRANHPMTCVSWTGADQFCRWAGGKLPPRAAYTAEVTSGGTRRFPWGDDPPTCDRAVINGGASWAFDSDGCTRKSTWPVCSKPAGNSVSGACDLIGNAWEWTEEASLMGGGWGNIASDGYLSADKGNDAPKTDTGGYVGFRCAR